MRVAVAMYKCLLALCLQAVIAFVASPASHIAQRNSACLHATKQTYKSFDDMIDRIPTPLLVDVYATWCGPCQMLAPELGKLGESMKGVVTVAKIDSEKYPAIASRLRVQALPTCVLLKDGQEIMRLMGFMTAQEMEDQIRAKLTQLGLPV